MPWCDEGRELDPAHKWTKSLHDTYLLSLPNLVSCNWQFY